MSTATHLGTIDQITPDSTMEITVEGAHRVVPMTMSRTKALDPLAHPQLNSIISFMGRQLGLARIAITFGAGDVAQVQYHYAPVNGGTPPETQPIAAGNGGIDSGITYDLDTSERAISILNHPKYKDLDTETEFKLDETTSDYLTEIELLALIIQQGALYDRNGTKEDLNGYLLSDAAEECASKIRKGQVSYNVSIPVLVKTQSGVSFPNKIEKLSTIQTPPSVAPEIDADRNWRYTGLRSSKHVGGQSTRVETWEASEPGGWDEDIYAPENYIAKPKDEKK